MSRPTRNDTPQVGSKETADAKPRDTPPPNEPAPTAIGFAPFRLFVNRRIGNHVRGVTLKHRDVEYVVTEITPDGQIRLERGDNIVLVPFDEEFIQPLLEQLL